MEIFEFFNRYILPLLITVVFIYVYSNWHKIKPIINKTRLKHNIPFLEKTLRIDFSKPTLTILLPIIAIISLDILIMLVFRLPMTTGEGNFYRYIVFSGIVNPIAEEVLIRGVLLGFVLLTSIEIAAKKDKRMFGDKKYYAWVFLALVFQAVLFASQHANFSSFQITIRMSHGIFYGLVYILYKRNLLPCIVSHSAHNFFLILFGP